MTDLTKLTKTELINIIESKEVIDETLHNITTFKNDSEYSASIRSGLFQVLLKMIDDDVKLSPSISKLNFDNFMTNGRIHANGLKQALQCSAYTKAELEIWLQHLSVVVVHELAKVIEKGVARR